MSEEVNKKIGDYQILNELGSGGMGRVYRVRNVITDRVEAMKVLLPDLAGRQELAARFQREIKVLASLNHPNIAQLRTALVLDNQLVMIMEYVEGRTLADRLDSGPVPVKDAVNYIDQVLNALSYAHQQHVIHRDIKPANMMLTPQGVVKLMDFGIARSGDERSLTMTGTTLGSLNYMSPEQVKGEATDARSDLYSVGVSLYELVTGRRPFQAGSDYSIMAAHINDTAKPPIELQPGLSPALNEIILIGIAKDPAQRFQTADAFRNALSSVHEGATAPAVNTPVVPVNFNATAPVLAPPPTRISSVAPPAAMAPMPPQQGSSHRGLYMTLGALVVLAVLVVA
jgi:serine/threonine protein kinase